MTDAYSRLVEHAAYLREGQARAARGEDISEWTEAHPNLETTLAFLDSALACADKITSGVERGMFVAYIDAALKYL